MNKAAQLFIN